MSNRLIIVFLFLSLICQIILISELNCLESKLLTETEKRLIDTNYVLGVLESHGDFLLSLGE